MLQVEWIRGGYNSTRLVFPRWTRRGHTKVRDVFRRNHTSFNTLADAAGHSVQEVSIYNIYLIYRFLDEITRVSVLFYTPHQLRKTFLR